eukprot:TRINITY_DN12242_c0_g1_i2.p1 TRINITY_DN12242_c0_g1~~TRINITY_DN12242_c0_g1_i2.p1  ORF type:complete len:554 (-),score=66.52 TRINITY_DN12242_c0_g1_i2:316-1977(-)
MTRSLEGTLPYFQGPQWSWRPPLPESPGLDCLVNVQARFTLAPGQVSSEKRVRSQRSAVQFGSFDGALWISRLWQKSRRVPTKPHGLLLLTSLLDRHCFFRWSQDVSQKIDKRETSPGPSNEIALLVDGDNHGLSHITQAMKILRDEGHLQSTHVFGAPGRFNSKQWKSTLRAGHVVLKEIPRDAWGAKEPNDLAITCEAMKLACLNQTKIISLLVNDIDFTFVVSEIKSLGKQVIVLIPKDRPGMINAYESAGACVISLASSEGKVHRPRQKAVLYRDGTGGMEPLEQQTLQRLQQSSPDRLRELFLSLGYTERETDPLLPAIAKFWHVNQLGDLTVWPDHLAYKACEDLLEEQSSRCWLRYESDLAFVIPQGETCGGKNLGRDDLALFGSRYRRKVAMGGGPFLLRRSSELPEQLLRKLGFLDGSMNESVEEALHVFCHVKANKKALRTASVRILHLPTTSAKLEQLKSVALSTKERGNWQIAPLNTSVREHLVGLHLLPNKLAKRAEVLNAMTDCVSRCGQTPMKTNGLVWQYTLHILNHSDPNRRQVPS